MYMCERACIHTYAYAWRIENKLKNKQLSELLQKQRTHHTTKNISRDTFIRVKMKTKTKRTTYDSIIEIFFLFLVPLLFFFFLILLLLLCTSHIFNNIILVFFCMNITHINLYLYKNREDYMCCCIIKKNMYLHTFVRDSPLNVSFQVNSNRLINNF